MGPVSPSCDLGQPLPLGGLCVVAVISFDLYLETVRSRFGISISTGGALRHGMGMTCQGYLGEEKAVLASS